MNYRCPIRIPCINGSPLANLSAEGPEDFVFRAIGYCCDGSLIETLSLVSRAAVDSQLDYELAEQCAPCPPGDPVDSTITDDNRSFDVYCAQAKCPDNTVLATICVTTSQADADANAAAQQAAMQPSCGDTSQLYSADC